MMRSQTTRGALVATAVLPLGGCDDLFITEGTEAVWQERYAVALLPGYTEFKGLDEYRVRVNPKTRRVTVMSGGFDSEVEIAHYERFAAMFRKHAESQ